MLKNKSPAFQFYPADYLSDANTVVFTAEQDGHYLRLLCFCWLEGSIPSNLDGIKKLLKGSSRVDKETLQPVLNCFKVDKKSGRLVHSRLLKEKKKQNDWRKKCSQAGKASGQTRRGSNGSKGSSTNVEQDCNTSSSSSSSFSTSVFNPCKEKNTKEAVRAFEVWVTTYEKEFGEYPEVDPRKDMPILEGLIGKHGLERVLEKINQHMKYGNYLSIIGFKTVWNSLGMAKKSMTRGAKKLDKAKQIMEYMINEKDTGNIFDIIPRQSNERAEQALKKT